MADKDLAQKFLTSIQARQDALAKKRDALLAPRSHDFKAGYFTGVEHGLILAGRHQEAAEIAEDLAKLTT